jgi:hypothetical protein
MIVKLKKQRPGPKGAVEPVKKKYQSQVIFFFLLFIRRRRETRVRRNSRRVYERESHGRSERGFILGEDECHFVRRFQGLNLSS